MINHSAAQGLDCDLQSFHKDLQKASELVVRLYRGLDGARITPAKSRMEIASLFDEPLPEGPEPIETILDEIEDKIFANSTLYLSPRFFGYINSGGNQAAVVGDFLASAVNQICALWHFSPAASEVERRVIRWIAQFIGYTPEAGGCLLSGGSAGNLVGLAVARKQKAQFDAASLGMRGRPPVTVYVSEEGHASIEKAMVLLGMGSNQLRKISVRDDFTIDLDSLDKKVMEDRKKWISPYLRRRKRRHDQHGVCRSAWHAGRVLSGPQVMVPYRRCVRRTCGAHQSRRSAFPWTRPG
jgi:aromatic-L-amino-acid decarboxylase